MERLRGAGLDVFAEEPPDPNHPAFRLPNLLVTPHIAGCTDGTFRNGALLWLIISTGLPTAWNRYTGWTPESSSVLPGRRTR